MKAGDRVRTHEFSANTQPANPGPLVEGEVTQVELVDGRAFVTVLAEAPHAGIWYFTEDDLELVCGACGGSGIHLEDHGQGAVEQLGCEHCQGKGIIAEDVRG